MRFRPCIDIHNGKVKQIIGGSLKDEGNHAEENFISELDAAWYAKKYRSDGLSGGHIILLNPEDSEYYKADVEQALGALAAYPGGLQIGGGIHLGNAELFLSAGASHVIVTSYVFKDGQIHFDRLKELSDKIGKEHLVLDVSCRKKGNDYYIVTDRWQKFTSVKMNLETLHMLEPYCDEFLIHAVDVEGKAAGIEQPIAKLLGTFTACPVTYAGGVGSFKDLHDLRTLGNNQIHVTIGSALDLFGGPLPYEIIKKLGTDDEVEL
ncbi:MAG: phosphoribosylformimino-5-aminoimidazole carboxamide ribotide isomerase [Lachnospiraceae bacterium]|nr:phosphoribosylformimino-5-aminoimidazole carboxamide ribotide isomerase [Lachnospiraceae bacterium]